MNLQRTIARKEVVSGIGVHTGSKCTMTLCPADPGSGIFFVRVDLPSMPVIPANIHHVAETARGTILGNGTAKVHTVEHIMAALWAFGITNLRIEIDAEEPPVGDGSSLVFVQMLESAGVVDQLIPADLFTVTRAISAQYGDTSITVLPHDGFRISYTLDYGHPLVNTQFVSLEVTQQSFVREIAPCRTFCFYREIESLMGTGLIQGGSLDNAVVVGDEAILSKEGLRFRDEFARHKILDLIGDMYLVGFPLRGHIIAVKSGHALNIQIVKMIREAFMNRLNGEAPPMQMTLEEIKEVLPHRYPFLMVDKITSVEDGQAQGIKNVTANESYFRGHFPEQALMPGVLQIEAMAQVAGASMMRMHQVDASGKHPILVRIDRVKFRKPVVPGDQLVIDVTWNKVRQGFGKARGRVRVNQQLVSEADITFALVEENP